MAPQDITISRWFTHFMGRSFPSVVGRGGISADKREGDGATPAATLKIVGILFRPDRVVRASLPRWAEPILPGDLWSDDPSDRHYNSAVRAPHGFSHEALRRPDPLYDLVLVTDWNFPMATAGKGSAIFLHRWRRPGYPTAGCIAFAPHDLDWIAAHVSLGTRVIVRR